MQYNGRQTDTHTHTDVSCVKCFLSFYTAAPLQPATHVSGKTWSKLLGNQTEPHRAFWLAVKVEKKHLTASNSKLSLCATSQPNMSSTFLCVAATQNLSTSLLFTPTDEMCHLTLPMEYGTLKKKRGREITSITPHNTVCYHQSFRLIQQFGWNSGHVFPIFLLLSEFFFFFSNSLTCF